jgi:hypothetical protein
LNKFAEAAIILSFVLKLISDRSVCKSSKKYLEPRE